MISVSNIFYLHLYQNGNGDGNQNKLMYWSWANQQFLTWINTAHFKKGKNLWAHFLWTSYILLSGDDKEKWLPSIEQGIKIRSDTMRPK